MWDIIFYKDSKGNEVIAEFLDSLPIKHRAKVLREIELLSEFGLKLREPHTKHISGKLWELRVKFSSDISRVFYFVPMNNTIILLHGFVKKTNETPKSEINTAVKRMNDYYKNGSDL